MQKQHYEKRLTRTRALTFIAALTFACTSLETVAFGTADDVLQAPLESEFKKLDTNHDGKLSHKEVARDKDFRGHFDRADSNNDGVLVSEEYSNYKSAAQQKRVEEFFDDSSVTAKIKAELIKDAGMKGLNISVETHKGLVILSGFVDNHQQMRRAVELASGIRGVESVKNALVVKG